MGRLIIDGNSFFEIDEKCLKRKKVSKSCGIDKYIRDDTERKNTRKEQDYQVKNVKNLNGNIL